MNLKPSDLSQNNYRLLDTLHHDELVPFVKTYLKKGTVATVAYYGSMMISFAVVLFFAMKFNHAKIITWSTAFDYMFLGAVGAFMLVPLHEGIHALAYKSVGAKHTSYYVNLKKFYFLAMANQFIASRKEFRVVALAPFVVISLGLIVTACVGNVQVTLIALSCLMTHSTLCSGDFALLSYFEFHRKVEIVTYDDKDEKMSYFYKRDL